MANGNRKRLFGVQKAYSLTRHHTLLKKEKSISPVPIPPNLPAPDSVLSTSTALNNIQWKTKEDMLCLEEISFNTLFSFSPSWILLAHPSDIIIMLKDIGHIPVVFTLARDQLKWMRVLLGQSLQNIFKVSSSFFAYSELPILERQWGMCQQSLSGNPDS